MPCGDLPSELITRLSPTDLRLYARAAGWVSSRTVPGQFDVLIRPDDELDQILIPLAPDADDYPARVAEVVLRLAEREGLPPAHVLNALLFPPSDVLRFNVAGQDMQRGDLSFEEGASMILGIRKSVMSAACSVIKPQAFHPKLWRSEAEQLVQACRLRQTELGSFTIVLACPLGAVEAPVSSADEAPFTRRATSLLMRSVTWIASTVDGGTAERAFDAAQEEESVSSNLCDGLLEMQPSDDRACLSISVEWDRSIPAPVGLDAVRAAHLRREHFAFVAALAQTLRPKPEQQRPELYVGRVEELRGMPDESGAMQGEVVLSLLSEDTALRARAELSPQAYGEAVDAHKTNRLVSLVGILRRGRRVHRVDSVTAFRILDDQPPAG